jgi:hypothetical protein
VHGVSVDVRMRSHVLSVHCPQAAISAEVAFKYDGYKLQIWSNGGYDSPAEAKESAASPTAIPNWRLARASRVPLLRRVCQLAGIQVAGKAYNFAAAVPLTAEVRHVRCDCVGSVTIGPSGVASIDV